MAPLRRHSTAAAVAAVVTALAVGLIAASALHAGAQPAPGPQGRQPGAAPAGEASTELRVAVKPIEPFVVATDDGWAGFSIDLWESLADRLGASFDYVEVDSVQGQLDAVAGGDADVAVAAISITSEREEAVDFSQPMYESGLQVLVPAGGGFRPGAILVRALDAGLIPVLVILLGSTMVMGLVLWSVERRTNEDFRAAGPKGLFDGMWWAVVTLTTVGYGDKVPRSTLGRALGMVWILFGIVFLTFFTAAVTSSLTVDELGGEIQGVEDLPGNDVVTVAGTTSADYLDDRGIGFRSVDSIEAAFDALATRSADAVLYDAPVVQFFVARGGQGIAQTAGPVVSPEYYGIALAEGSPLVEPVNVALLGVNEDGTYERLRTKWFGAGD